MSGLHVSSDAPSGGVARRLARWIASGPTARWAAVVPLTLLAVGATFSVQTGVASAAPKAHAGANPLSAPFTECPPVGGDTGCGILVVVTDSGEQILQDPTQPAYDTNIGQEDTSVGIVNESSQPVSQIQLSSSTLPIFGFDEDGVCTFATGGSNEFEPGGFPFGSSYCASYQLDGMDPGDYSDPLGADYQGPNNTFSNISSDTMSGTVNFNTPLAPGSGSTFFSLEDPLSSCDFSTSCGYWEVGADGGIFSYGASYHGSVGGKPLNAPIVALASDPVTGGYWEVASDGGLFAQNAPFFGSMGGQPLNSPIVGMVATPDGGGYWEVAADGGLFAFGDAVFHGSMGGKRLNAPVVGIATTQDGGGYWEVASDGGLFAYGDASFSGSMGGQHLNRPVVGMTGDPATGGYWEVASDGGLFAFGAPFEGSMGDQYLNKPIIGMASTPDGAGYWEVASDGGIFNFGDADFHGSAGNLSLNSPIVGVAVSQ